MARRIGKTPAMSSASTIILNSALSVGERVRHMKARVTQRLPWLHKRPKAPKMLCNSNCRACGGRFLGI